MVCSSTNSTTSYANVLERLGRVHPQLISSSLLSQNSVVGSTGQIDDLQSSNECSQHGSGSLLLYRWEPRDQQSQR